MANDLHVSTEDDPHGSDTVQKPQRFATIGDDGTRPVVWGVGDSEEQSIRDAHLNMGSVSVAHDSMALRTVPIDEERYRAIIMGDVDASGL